MRKFNNYEAVKINNAEEAMKFLKYLEDTTNLEWQVGGKPTEIRSGELNKRGFPIFIERCGYTLWLSRLNGLENETKIVPLSEFIKPKVTYTREQAEAVLKDCNQFHTNLWSIGSQAIAFLDHKFPKSTLEQVTEAVKDLGDFSIEQTISGEIIISPIKITEE